MVRLTLGGAALMLQQRDTTRGCRRESGEGVRLWVQCHDTLAVYH
jgi:hypothetical protein